MNALKTLGRLIASFVSSLVVAMLLATGLAYVGVGIDKLFDRPLGGGGGGSIFPDQSYAPLLLGAAGLCLGVVVGAVLPRFLLRRERLMTSVGAFFGAQLGLVGAVAIGELGIGILLPPVGAVVVGELAATFLPPRARARDAVGPLAARL